ncbi:MAG: tetratricopeptide repeat protein [Vicingaceae bacterium]
MTANDILISVIGLFLAFSGLTYLLHLRKEKQGGMQEKVVSWSLLAIGLIVTGYPLINFNSASNEKVDPLSRSGSLLGSDVYDQAVPTNTGSYEEATALYVKAVSYFNQALAGYDSVEVALDLLNRSVQAYETAEALTARGQIKVQQGKFSSAFEDYFRAIELKPGFGNAYFNRAAVYYITGQLNYACSDWRRANELGVPNTEEVLKTYCGN